MKRKLLAAFGIFGLVCGAVAFAASLELVFNKTYVADADGNISSTSTNNFASPFKLDSMIFGTTNTLATTVTVTRVTAVLPESTTTTITNAFGDTEVITVNSGAQTLSTNVVTVLQHGIAPTSLEVYHSGQVVNATENFNVDFSKVWILRGDVIDVNVSGGDEGDTLQILGSR